MLCFGQRGVIAFGFVDDLEIEFELLCAEDRAFPVADFGFTSEHVRDRRKLLTDADEQLIESTHVQRVAKNDAPPFQYVYIIAEIINIVADERFLSEDGLPDIEKMQLITYDPIHKGYIELGKRIGNAFCDGKRLK